MFIFCKLLSFKNECGKFCKKTEKKGKYAMNYKIKSLIFCKKEGGKNKQKRAKIV